VDGYRSTLDIGGTDYTELPHLGSSRFARVGDLLQLSVENETFAHHPFHLHGFSFQPLRVYDAGSNTTLFAFDYNEFIDNWDLHAGQGLEFRVLLEERPSVAEILAGGEGGGAVGRWLFHCHILHHAALGMLSELVVVNEIFEDGFESGDTTRWSRTVP